ncbi:hypothetical protein SeMB42_g06817 [Synchytrium endobioticum]|uniref:Uncharacterized protein n=1 Tax=Synchytrium endobioticum TaxID=286115 RepID=A0A507D1H3_9FUNG|nr:hypothetical protein SeMB42_g06817 [Synchytrium endobioticum]TPX45171.1 hypothetical protein SeLEV6574_g04032 [Synchytrium endobioticum]
MSKIPLSRLLVKELGVGKLFSENNGKRITSIDFDADGTHCITASEDESLNLYDVLRGEQIKTIYSKKYGCDLARFTHTPNTVLYASTKEDDAIRYVSLHDNQFIRYFKGHKARVTSLDVCPVDDRFISSSLDHTIRLWNLGSPTCQGCVYLQNTLQGPAIAAWDPAGVIIAVGLSGARVLLLYDVANMQNGHFQKFHLQEVDQLRECEWTSVKFSPNGGYILICTNGLKMYLVDAFQGRILGFMTGFENKGKCKLEGGFTRDCKFIFCGSSDGKIHFWEVPGLEPVATLGSPHTEAIQSVAFSPQYLVMASADNKLALWTPKSFD